MAKKGKVDWLPIASYDDKLLAGGINDAAEVLTGTYAKWNSDVSPYCIPNEWICGRIAQYLCLPVRPFALVYSHEARRGLFGSMGYSSTSEPPPDTDAVACYTLHRDLCSGILMFDVLIANTDRYEKNILVDNSANPKHIRLIDHERALLGYREKEAIARLNEMRDRLGISGGSVSGGNWHIFLPLLDDTESCYGWINRIHQLPDWYIEDTCRHVVGVGITATECKRVVDFLKHRRDHLLDILTAHRGLFTAVKRWGGLFF